MADIRLTPQQQTAVSDRQGSLLVAASAGSGKTKVLVERLFSYLSEGVDMDEFLIITYTKAAAAELRGKIAAELSHRIAEDPENRHLRRQLLWVYQTDIKTVDAFCVGLLRQNTHLLDAVDGHTLTPDFRVLDEQEAQILRQRVLDRTLEGFYENLTPADELLAETLGAGRSDHGLEELVLDLHNKLQSHPYPLEWMADVRRQWENLPDDLGDTPWGRVIMNDTLRKARFWVQRLRRAVEDVRGNEKVYSAYSANFYEVIDELEKYEAAALRGWQAMSEPKPTFGRMGRTPDSPEKEHIRAVLEQCKKALAKLTVPYLVPQSEHLEDLQAMAPAMLSLIDLTAEFTRQYQSEKVRRNVMDFSDQEHYAISLLQRNNRYTELAERLSAHYREVMVDEYQDSNAVQDCIFNAVSGAGRHLFCVGDVKQSIYRFRMADPTIFLEKYMAYHDAWQAQDEHPRRVLLNSNFRSRREVLDTANFVMAGIMSPEMGEMAYAEQEMLQHGATYYLPNEMANAEFHFISVEDTDNESFDRPEVEAAFTAHRIRQLLDEGFPVQEGDSNRPCTPEDIVILMRSPRSQLKLYSDALSRLGIPCSGDEGGGFFDTVEIAIVLSLLQIIDNPRQDVPLISSLRSPIFGFSADRLAAIRALQKEGDYYDALMMDKSEDTAAFLQILSALRQTACEESVDVLLWQLYTTLHIPEIFSAMPGGQQRKERLVILYNYARQMAASGKRSVFAFVSQLQKLMDNDDLPDFATHTAGGGVRIMSIHSSKGLEFPIVLLCGLSRRFNESDERRPVLVHRELGLGSVRVDPERRVRFDTVTKTAVAMQINREAKSEEMRILYVALTRAREKLIMVHCMKNGAKKLKELLSNASYPVAPEAVSTAGCMGEWILMPILATVQAETLRDLAEQNDSGELTDLPGLQVHLWRNPVNDEAVTVKEEIDDAERIPFDPVLLDSVYAHQRAVAIPTKITATQLKGRDVDAEIAEGAVSPVHRNISFEKPAFLRGKHAITSTERGTAIHLAMQYLDFRTPADVGAVSQELQIMVEKRLLTTEQASAVEPQLLTAFLRSELCRRIGRSRRVWREFPFALLMPATIYDPAAVDEEMMLQGVVDCAFVEDGQLVIVDFKTDHIAAAQQKQRSESYRAQLDAYCRAMERVTELPVKEKLLYFFQTDSTEKL